MKTRLGVFLLKEFFIVNHKLEAIILELILVRKSPKSLSKINK